jgi:hypothetical protein
MPAISSGYSGRDICACTVARVLTYGGQRDCVENALVVGQLACMKWKMVVVVLVESRGVQPPIKRSGHGT